MDLGKTDCHPSKNFQEKGIRLITNADKMASFAWAVAHSLHSLGTISSLECKPTQTGLAMRWHKQSESWHKVTGSGQMWFVNRSKPPYGKPPILSDECSELHNAQALRPRRLTRTLSYSPDTGASRGRGGRALHPKIHDSHRQARDCLLLEFLPLRCLNITHLINCPWIYAIKNRPFKTKRGHQAGFGVPIPACTFLFLGEFSLNI